MWLFFVVVVVVFGFCSGDPTICQRNECREKRKKNPAKRSELIYDLLITNRFYQWETFSDHMRWHLLIHVNRYDLCLCRLFFFVVCGSIVPLRICARRMRMYQMSIAWVNSVGIGEKGPKQTRLDTIPFWFGVVDDRRMCSLTTSVGPMGEWLKDWARPCI